jgi:hypothetical protein
MAFPIPARRPIVPVLNSGTLKVQGQDGKTLDSDFFGFPAIPPDAYTQSTPGTFQIENN